VITEKEWKALCANRYIERSGVSLNIARQMAEACFEAEREASEGPLDLTDCDPEDSADDDMSYWDYD